MRTDTRNVSVSISAKGSVPSELLVKANLKDIAKYMAQEWLILIATWLLLTVSPTWLYPLGVIIICGRFNALGALLHDACHVKRSDTVYSTLVDWLGGYPIGLSIEGMRYHHLRHHRYACTELDPYLKRAVEQNKLMRLMSYLRGLLVIIAWCIRPYYGLLARIWPNLKNGYAKFFFGDKSKEDLSGAKDIDLCLQRDIGQIIYQSIIIGLVFAFPNWMFLNYIIPLIAASVLNSYRVVEEHTHEVTDDHSPINIVNYTNDQPMDFISRFLFFPRNIGYHRMHHLHPTVRYEKLPELQRWYAEYNKTSSCRKALAINE